MASDEPMVGIVGTGPAVEAIAAAVDDCGADTRKIEPGSAAAVKYLCVVDTVGARSFETVTGERTDPWIAIELGGLGGESLPDVAAGVSVLSPTGGCFRCLQARVRANLDDGATDAGRADRSDLRLAGALAGRLAVDWVTADAPTGRVIELPYAERELLPVQTCSCVGDRSRAVDLTHTAVDLEATVARAERTIDGRLGIISSIGEAESFPAPYYLSTLADTTTFSDAAAGPQAAGVAVDWNAAFMKAAGEALERYAAGVYRTRTFRTATIAEVERPIPPSAFVRPDGYPELARNESIPWLPGVALGPGADVWLPAEFVQFPPPNERFKPAITTGLGLGTSMVDAILSGLYEVIERDATMLAWYSTFEPLGLAIDDDGVETLSRRARAEGLTVTPLLVTQDIDVPVVSVAVHRDGGWPQFAIGSGADLDPIRATRSALAEALQNWMELRGMGPERAEAEEASAIGRYSHFPREVGKLVSPEGTVAAAELGPDAPLEGAAALDAVLERTVAVDLATYVARLTTADLDRSGFEAVRVLAPSAQPLFIDERYFGERARTVPRELGFRPRFDRPPHPYP